MAAVHIRTEQLWLRPFAAPDADALHGIFVQPEVRRYLLDDRVMPPEWVREVIADSEATFAHEGFGLWTLALERDGAPVGAAGFRRFHEPPVVELLYLLDRGRWGRGLAHEASRAALRYGFEALGFDPIAASIDAPNEASIRLACRLGLREVRRSPGSAHELVHFELARREFDPGSDRYEAHGERGA